jgi:hypothetical protein
MTSRMSVLKEFLQRDVAVLVAELVPGARRSGTVWSAKNPRRADRSAGSFTVWVGGGGHVAGAWKDWASGDAGDVVDLVAYCRGWTRGEVLAWGEDRYGIRSMSAEERRRLQARQVERKVAEQRDDQARELKRREAAIRLFDRAVPRLTGTLVEVYAEARGTPLRAMPTLEHQWFRFHPSLEWWEGAERDPETGEKTRPGPRFPALLSAMVDRVGTMRAVHCTFLSPDGRGKAPVDRPKLMFPRTEGLVIRVSRGDSRVSPETAAANGLIGPGVVGEGVEDGWTWAMALPEARTFAAGSLAGLLHMPDLACIDAWLVARDNDWGKDQAKAQFDKAMSRIKSFGKPAEEVSATGGAKDFNDMVR